MDFGEYVAELRKANGMGVVELAKAVHLTHPAIVAVESGQRAVGDDLAGRLLLALQVNECDREEFMLKAASTRIHRRLVGSANEAPPTLTHYLMKILGLQGVKMNEVKDAQTTSNIPGEVIEKAQVQQQFESGLAEFLKGVGTNVLSSLPLLKLELNNGERMVCGVLLAKC